MENLRLHFKEALHLNLRFLHRQVTDPLIATEHFFKIEISNIQNAINFGLTIDTTFKEACVLLLSVFPTIVTMNKSASWLPQYTNAVENSRLVEDSLRIKLLNRTGQIFRLQRNFEDAILLHRDAECLAIKLEDTLQIGISKFQLGSDYESLRELRNAEMYGLEALTYLENVAEELTWKAGVYQLLGMVAREKGELNKAIEMLLNATSLWYQINEPSETARALNNLANAYQRNNQISLALQTYHQALQQVSQTTDEVEKSKIHNGLGSLYYDKEDYANAKLNFLLANSVELSRSGEFHTQAAIAQNIGLTLYRQKLFQESEFYLSQSLRLWENANDILNKGNSIGTLGLVKEATGNEVEAKVYFKEALNIFENFPHDLWASRLYERYSLLLKKLQKNNLEPEV